MRNSMITLSSAGLRNIIINPECMGNDFRFIFGSNEIGMNNIFAEFTSPTVSRLHYADQSIDSLCFDSFLANMKHSHQNRYDEFFSEDILSLFQKISQGFSIEVNEDQSFKLHLLSMLIGNEELSSQINKIYPFEINEANIDQYLQNLQFIQNYSSSLNSFDYSTIIDFIASHFYLIDINKFAKLSKSIFYSIVANKHLKIESEDSLFDAIQLFFMNQKKETQKNDECIDIISFYEEINFSLLSEVKFHSFLNEFDFNEMTNTLWTKLSQCFHISSHPTLTNSERYSFKGLYFGFDGKNENRFHGIIHHLTAETGGNVNDNGTVITTASTICNGHYSKYAVDLDDDTHYFQSVSIPNSWLKFDFKERKIRPSNYSIRTRHDCDQGGYHPKNWVIEGSNTDNDNDWKILD